MRVSVFASLLALFALLSLSRRAHADEVAREAKGLAVLATDGATDAAWPIARAVYGSELLRPPTVDDARARVLAGEPTTSEELKELAEYRAGVKGDDVVSRQVLVALSEKLSLRGIVVVFAGDTPKARLFDASSRSFDAAVYAPDSPSAQQNGELTWNGAVRSLERPYKPQPTPLVLQPPALEPKKEAPKKSESKAFYE
jgi:hypothetical protein